LTARAGWQRRGHCGRDRAIAYQDRIAECNDADLHAFVPWHAGEVGCGFVHRQNVDWLLQHAPAFTRRPDGLGLCADDFVSRSAALAALAVQLVSAGRVPALRGELYPVVRTFGEPPLLQLDRAAVPWFGVRPFGVHLNGFVQRPDGVHLWIAERAHDKPTFPGRWDNTVAGGQPIGLSLQANLTKECAEEAGIPAPLAARALPVGCITYVRAGPEGLKPDTLFCYDLDLPPDFTPVPHDGEVERFFLLPVRAVADVVRDQRRFKPNCNLVLIDFFLRHGVLDAELPADARAKLARALRAPLP